jgi:hypothetical protein
MAVFFEKNPGKFTSVCVLEIVFGSSEPKLPDRGPLIAAILNRGCPTGILLVAKHATTHWNIPLKADAKEATSFKDRAELLCRTVQVSWCW